MFVEMLLRLFKWVRLFEKTLVLFSSSFHASVSCKPEENGVCRNVVETFTYIRSISWLATSFKKTISITYQEMLLMRRMKKDNNEKLERHEKAHSAADFPFFCVRSMFGIVNIPRFQSMLLA